MTRMAAPPTPKSSSTPTPTPALSRGRDVAVEQLSMSVLQLSPAVAAMWLSGEDTLAWTASFGAVLALFASAFRGLVTQPSIRVATGSSRPTYPRRAAVAVTMAGMALTGITGVLDVVHDQGTLVLLALALPGLALIEMERAGAASTNRPPGAMTLLALVGGGVLAGAPLIVSAISSPGRIVAVWLTLLAIVAIVGSTRRSYEFGGDLHRDGFAVAGSNLMGQAVAQAPILLLSALASAGAVSQMQVARLVYRPIVVAAAALPIHLLPRLVGETPAATRRLIIRIVAGTAAAAVLLTPAILIGRVVSDAIAIPPLSLFFVAAAVTVISVAEAALSVRELANRREARLLLIRLAAAAAALACGVWFIDDSTGPLAALGVLALGPLAVVAALSLRNASVEKKSVEKKSVENNRV